MKLSPRLKKSIRIATPVLLALLLSIAILPGAALAQGPSGYAGIARRITRRIARMDSQEERKATPSGDPTATETPPVNSARNDPVADPANGSARNGSGPKRIRPKRIQPQRPTAAQRPRRREPDSRMLVLPSRHRLIASSPMPLHRHKSAPSAAASSTTSSVPAVLSLARGSSPFSELATLHAGGASLYSGTNPFTGKSVQIHYMPAEQKIRVSTFYPDNQYDTNKPYNFTVDANNSVSHEAW